mmetsp:Transcript_32922/g.76183  ORF Transcript_32922/g.76183 Transcript_32922/m.76183 type:complete len:207 (-) Transcript_32922:46-666(-)
MTEPAPPTLCTPEGEVRMVVPSAWRVTMVPSWYSATVVPSHVRTRVEVSGSSSAVAAPSPDTPSSGSYVAPEAAAADNASYRSRSAGLILVLPLRPREALPLAASSSSAVGGLTTRERRPSIVVITKSDSPGPLRITAPSASCTTDDPSRIRRTTVPRESSMRLSSSRAALGTPTLVVVMYFMTIIPSEPQVTARPLRWVRVTETV